MQKDCVEKHSLTRLAKQESNYFALCRSARNTGFLKMGTWRWAPWTSPPRSVWGSRPSQSLVLWPTNPASGSASRCPKVTQLHQPFHFQIARRTGLSSMWLTELTGRVEEAYHFISLCTRLDFNWGVFPAHSELDFLMHECVNV